MPDKLKSILANNIKRHRAINGWTITEFAGKVGVSPKAVRQLEAAKVWISAPLLARVAKAFRCEPWQLLKNGNGDR